jgi:hypothetical protein
MLFAFTCFTALSGVYSEGKVEAGKADVVFIWIQFIFYSFAWTGQLVAYTVEILPFKLRAKGLMLMNFFVSAALTFNQYINPIGFEKLNPKWKFYSVYCVSDHSLVLTIAGESY